MDEGEFCIERDGDTVFVAERSSEETSQDEGVNAEDSIDLQSYNKRREPSIEVAPSDCNEPVAIRIDRTPGTNTSPRLTEKEKRRKKRSKEKKSKDKKAKKRKLDAPVTDEAGNIESDSEEQKSWEKLYYEFQAAYFRENGEYYTDGDSAFIESYHKKHCIQSLNSMEKDSPDTGNCEVSQKLDTPVNSEDDGIPIVFDNIDSIAGADPCLNNQMDQQANIKPLFYPGPFMAPNPVNTQWNRMPLPFPFFPPPISQQPMNFPRPLSSFPLVNTDMHQADYPHSLTPARTNKLVADRKDSASTSPRSQNPLFGAPVATEANPMQMGSSKPHQRTRKSDTSRLPQNFVPAKYRQKTKESTIGDSNHNPVQHQEEHQQSSKTAIDNAELNEHGSTQKNAKPSCQHAENLELQQMRDKMRSSMREADSSVVIHETVPAFIAIEESLSCIPESQRKYSRIARNHRRLSCTCVASERSPSCGSECPNRLLLIECLSNCGELCTNNNFTNKKHQPLDTVKVPGKGWGLRSEGAIQSGSLVTEIVGELISINQMRQRLESYHKRGISHHYMVSLTDDEVLDATVMGNKSRFVNHSCNPNCEIQEWTVNGQLRLGIFALQDIEPGTELTYDYEAHNIGDEGQECRCGVPQCRGVIRSRQGSQDSQPSTKSYQLLARRIDQLIERCGSTGLTSSKDVVDLCRLMLRVEKMDDRARLLPLIIATGARSDGKEFMLRLVTLHCLSFLWLWMVEPGNDPDQSPLNFILLCLQALLLLPVSCKKVLKKSKLLPLVQRIAKEFMRESPEVKKSIEAQSSEGPLDTKEYTKESPSQEDSETSNCIPLKKKIFQQLAEDREPDDKKESAIESCNDLERDISKEDGELEVTAEETEGEEERLKARIGKLATEVLEIWSQLEDVGSVLPSAPSEENGKEKADAPDIQSDAMQKSSETLSPMKGDESGEIKSDLEKDPAPTTDDGVGLVFDGVGSHNGSDASNKSGPVHTPDAHDEDSNDSFGYNGAMDRSLDIHTPPGQPPPHIACSSPIVAPGSGFVVQPGQLIYVQTNQGLVAQQIPLSGGTVTSSQMMPQSLESNSSASNVVTPVEPSPRKLPRDWRSADDGNGKTYYYHAVTRQTQWEFPQGSVDDEDFEPESPSLELDDSIISGGGSENMRTEASSDRKRSHQSTNNNSESSNARIAKAKNDFRQKLSKYIVAILNNYMRSDCKTGRITNAEDFKHLARKISHFILSKELQKVKSAEKLRMNDLVANKTKNYIKSYMNSVGPTYRRNISKDP